MLWQCTVAGIHNTWFWLNSTRRCNENNKSEYQEKKKMAEENGDSFHEPSELYGNPFLSRWTLVLEIYVLLVAIWVCRPLREQN